MHRPNFAVVLCGLALLTACGANAGDAPGETTGAQTTSSFDACQDDSGCPANQICDTRMGSAHVDQCVVAGNHLSGQPAQTAEDDDYSGNAGDSCGADADCNGGTASTQMVCAAALGPQYATCISACHFDSDCAIGLHCATSGAEVAATGHWQCEPTPAAAPAAPADPGGSTAFPNDQVAYSYFISQGLTSFQAAGIVGNLDQESGDNPASVQSGGPGQGIAQWSAGGRWDTDASDNAVWYAGQQGESVSSLSLQLDFIWYELTTFSGYGLASLMQTTNVTDATVAFETDFEGCGKCDQSARIAYAQAVLSAFGPSP